MNWYLEVLKKYATFTGRARRWIILLVFYATPGTPGNNSYGTDPKQSLA
ncbi:MAG: hypothetical protein ACHQIL_03290 [Steroidobacterales bacterium]